MSTLRQQIETRIAASAADFTAAGLRPFREVAGAAGIANILNGRVSAPGCYIYRARLRPGPNVYDDAVMQRVEAQFGIVSVVRNVADARQGDASDLAEAYSDVIQARLLNWSPDEYTEQFEFAGGQVVRLQNEYLYWQDLYRTASIIRQT
jgi:hypothetical protein